MLARLAKSLDRRKFMGLGISAFASSFGTRLGAGPEVETSAGRLLGIIPFVDEGRPEYGRLKGEGLRGRLAFQLSTLREGRLLVPNHQFYIRTAHPSRMDAPGEWRIRGQTPSRQPAILDIAALRKRSQPLGPHLLECSGNSRRWGFGLMSAAEWSGVPWDEVLSLMGWSRPSQPVLISGFDEHSKPYGGSSPGASWIFTPGQLASSRAFLATGMNGRPLPVDHGFPVRLMVPGWYGCCCIKWVNEIRPVSENALATSQMREFASRTHQGRLRRRALDFQPARLDTAAMPVRVEKRVSGGRPFYRIVGIIWGGRQRLKRLLIRFNPDSAYVPVDELDHRTSQIWSLWTHRWEPTAPGRYRIELKVGEPRLQTRRLDRGYYARAVQIDEV